MKLADTYIQFYSPRSDERKFISLEQLIVFSITDIRDADNGLMFRVNDNLYAWRDTSRGMMYVTLPTEAMLRLNGL